MDTVTAPSPPPAQDWTLAQRDGGFFAFRGQHLGSGSSWVDGKERWFEVDIYRDVNGVYVVHTVGRSARRDEVPLVRIISTHSAFEVLTVLVVNHNGKTYLPRQSDRALAQAAHWDDDIRDAYINRAVT